MPLNEHEEAEASRYMQMILAAGVSGRMGAYKGVLNDTEVVVLAATFPKADGLFDAKPLALLFTDDVARMVDIPHAGSVEVPGQA